MAAAKRGSTVATNAEVVAAAESAASRAEEAKAKREARQAREAARGPAVYVVQQLGVMRESSDGVVEWVGDETGGLWVDICTVSVPARSKRKTIIEAARREVAIELPATLRILDADAAREFPVGLKPRDPELVIG